jgi:hypothetical protein
MKIRTNKRWHPFLDRWQVPRKILDNEMDWCDSDTGFFKYLGTWYHTSQFMRDAAPEGWHGAHSESAWDGVLIKLNSDGECFQVARFSS